MHAQSSTIAPFGRGLLASACLIALAGGAARAQAVARPAAAEIGEERVVSIDFDDVTVIARGARGVIFTVNHSARPVDRDVEVGGRFYYAYSIYLMEVDPEKGSITRRVPFPGVIEDIEKQGSSIQIKLKDWEGETLGFRPGERGPMLLPMDEEAIRAPQMDAERLVPPAKAYYDSAEDENRDLVEILRRGVFDKAARCNPTNPWYHFVKGVILARTGSGDEARRAFRDAASTEGAPFFDYLRISSLLARRNEFAESEICFERGLAEFVRAGYEPELLMSARAYRLYMGAEGGPEGASWHASAVGVNTGHIEVNDRKLADVDRSIELMERTWRLAPRCEGVGYAFAGMAEFLEEQGRSEDAEVWYARAREAVRYSQSVGSRQFVNASVACLLALVILVAIVFYRSFPAQRGDLAGEGGWFASWRNAAGRFRHMAFAYANRLELLGIFLVAAAGFASSVFVMRGERALRRSLAIPEEAKTGTWVHPRAITILNDLSRGSDAANLLYCIARQQAGNDEEKTYGDLAGGSGPIAAIAQNNLGVIFARRGKHDKAERAFEKALELEPGLVEAEYNLHGSALSARVSRMRKYRPGEKVIALPDAEILASAFAGAPKPEKPPHLLVAKPYRLGVPNWLTMLVTCAVGLLVLPFLLIRREPPERKRGPLASLAYVVPWTSTRLVPLGGLLLASWIYCVIALILVIDKSFLTTLEPASQEIIKGHFGLAGGVFFGFEQALAFFGPVGVVVLWALNLLFLVRAGRAAPSARPTARGAAAAAVKMKVPAGPAKKARPARPSDERAATGPAEEPAAKLVREPPEKAEEKVAEVPEEGIREKPPEEKAHKEKKAEEKAPEVPEEKAVQVEEAAPEREPVVEEPAGEERAAEGPAEEEPRESAEEPGEKPGGESAGESDADPSRGE